MCNSHGSFNPVYIDCILTVGHGQSVHNLTYTIRHRDRRSRWTLTGHVFPDFGRKTTFCSTSFAKPSTRAYRLSWTKSPQVSILHPHPERSCGMACSSASVLCSCSITLNWLRSLRVAICHLGIPLPHTHISSGTWRELSSDLVSRFNKNCYTGMSLSTLS